MRSSAWQAPWLKNIAHRHAQPMRPADHAETRSPEQRLGTDKGVVVLRPAGTGARISFDRRRPPPLGVPHGLSDQRDRNAAAPRAWPYRDAGDDPYIDIVD